MRITPANWLLGIQFEIQPYGAAVQKTLARASTTFNVLDVMRKRLFVFCDGTWKDGVNKAQPLTNVGALARCLERVSDDNYLQVVYYDSGVGNGTGGLTRGIDGATGRGIAAKIRNAYSFLAHNYTHDEEDSDDETEDSDEIILVGFSRGAFAVQCLASFISQVGLLQANHLYYLRGLFALWANQNFSPVGQKSKKPLQDELKERVRMFFSEEITHKVAIKACVVWDTVSSLGLPTPWPRPLSHVGSAVPEQVQNAFQALALDERRVAFKPCIWKTKEDQSTFVKQCWFLGSHSDVGGSGDAALGLVSLIWVIGLLQAKTRTKFDWNEVGKHATHKFLEWDYDVSRILGYFRQRSILSKRSSSGQTTSPSLFWWFLGIQKRQIIPEAVPANADSDIPTSVHFTVRLVMATKPNTCPVLRKWQTVMSGDGSVCWRQRERSLPEDRLNGNDPVTRRELAILERWCNDTFNVQQTDRSRFAISVRALILNPQSDAHLESFADFLRENLRFEENRLAPDKFLNVTIPSQALGTLRDIQSNARCPLCRLVKHILYGNPDAPLQVSRDFHAKDVDDDKVQCVLHPVRQDYNEEMEYENSRTRDLVATQAEVYLRGTPHCTSAEARSIFTGPVDGIGFHLLSPGSVDPARPLANGFRVTSMDRNLELLSQWLQTCQSKHKDTCHATVFPTACSPAGISRIRVIDVQNRTISECNIAEVEYAALSYVWGENKEARVKLVSDLAPGHGNPEKTAVSLPLEVPQVVEDALRICAAISIPYLWVDLYCIDQHDAQQKAAEINAMGYIYNHAQITLVDGHDKMSTDAGAGLLPEDTTGDLGANQRIETIGDKSYITSLPQTIDRIHASQWETRAWTYQEGALSKRVAMFSRFDVSFMCGAGLWCERLHSGEHGHDADLSHLDLRSSGYRVLASSDRLQKVNWEFAEYDGILMAYSGRSLSFESDKVAAISGCFNILAQNMDLHFVCGLPTKDFHYALLWDGQEDQLREGFPSWSWAGSHSRQQSHRLYPKQETSGSLVPGKSDDIYEYRAHASSEIELDGTMICGMEAAHPPNRCRQRPAPLQLSTKLFTVSIRSEMAHFSVDIIASDTKLDSDINTKSSEARSWEAGKMYSLDLALRNSAGSQCHESGPVRYRPWPPLRIGLPVSLRGSTITWLLRDGIDLVNILDIEMLDGDAGGDSLPSRRVFCLGIDKSQGGNRRMGTVHMPREMWEAACPTTTSIELI